MCRMLLRGVLPDRVSEVSLGGTQASVSEALHGEGEQGGGEVHGGHQEPQGRGHHHEGEGCCSGSLPGTVQGGVPGLLRLAREDLALVPAVSRPSLQQEM